MAKQDQTSTIEIITRGREVVPGIAPDPKDAEQAIFIAMITLAEAGHPLGVIYETLKSVTDDLGKKMTGPKGSRDGDFEAQIVITYLTRRQRRPNGPHLISGLAKELYSPGVHQSYPALERRIRRAIKKWEQLETRLSGRRSDRIPPSK